MARILVLNGPNLNLLGSREPGHYGSQSLEDIMAEMSDMATACGVSLEHLQSNSEGALIDAIHGARDQGVDYIIFTPAGLTHTSIALRDALLAVEIPFIEVHLSAVDAREPFRQKTFFADIALGVISGFRGESYLLALQAVVNRIDPQTE